MRIALAAALAAALGCGSCGGRRSILGTHASAAPAAVDAGMVATAAPPDAEPPDAAPPPPPATLTFAPAAWAKGRTIKLWRRATLSKVSGSQDLVDQYELTFTVDDVDAAGTHVKVADDCHAILTRGTAKVTGECGGHASDVAYRLDLVAQLLAIPHGTITVGDLANGFTRPLVALFRLQDAGALMTSHAIGADAAGVTYAIHTDLEGTLLRPGLRVVGKLDGTIHVDAAVTAITGTMSAPKVAITGYPIADYTSKGALELSFGIEPL